MALANLQDSITGLLLAGIGHIDNQQKKNFLIVDGSTCRTVSPEVLVIRNRLRVQEYIGLTPCAETQTTVIEAAFQDFTERKDIAILLINQHVSSRGLESWIQSERRLGGEGSIQAPSAFGPWPRGSKSGLELMPDRRAYTARSG